MTVDRPSQTQSTPTTQPQVPRNQARLSSSDLDEYSSEYATDRSERRSNETEESYETPPSRLSTPLNRNRAIESEMTIPILQSHMQAAIMNTQSEDKKPILSQAAHEDGDTVTPDHDDTSIIRFALEQLNYDEEVNGPRHDSLTSGTYPDLSRIPQVDVNYKPAPPTQPPTRSHPPVVTATAALPETPARQPISVQPQRPAQVYPPYVPLTPRSTSSIPRRPLSAEVFRAVDPPEGQRWLELGFVPFALRFSSLALYLFANMLMMAGLIFSNVFALRHHGLYNYDNNFSPRYFVFQYLPQIVGMIMIFWRFVIQAAIFRTTAFFRLSSRSTNSQILQTSCVTPSNFFLPDTTLFRSGERLMGIACLLFWLSNLTIPLLSCLYQTQWYTDDGPARWRWTTVQGVGWTLFALYLLLAVATILCMIHFRRSKSGLMWDPKSLADMISLFHNSNLLPDFERAEVAAEMMDVLPIKPVRLGFWTTSQHPNVFHGIGEQNGMVREISAYTSPQQLLKHRESSRYSEDTDVEVQRESYASSFVRSVHSPYVRYRWIAWYLRDGFVLAWGIIAVSLLIAFLVISFVKRAVQDGFYPLLPSTTRSGGFSNSNFLYSFLPSLLGMFLFLWWQSIDNQFRVVQPYANMSGPEGADARRSLLLAYPSYLPVQVTIKAMRNGDLKVAYISFISLLSATIPVLAGGVFTAALFQSDNQVRMIASMPGYISLCVFVAIYALSFLIIWPTRKRYLPHPVSTVAEIVSFLYASPLLAEGNLRNLRSKADLEQRLTGTSGGNTGTLTGDRTEKSSLGRRRIQGRRNLQHGPSRYTFGVYVGRDGREHLGIDRLQRPGSGEWLSPPRISG